MIHRDTLFVARAGAYQVLLLQDGNCAFDPISTRAGIGLTQIPAALFKKPSRTCRSSSAEFLEAARQEGALASLGTDVRAIQERIIAEENPPAALGSKWKLKPEVGASRLELTSRL